MFKRILAKLLGRKDARKDQPRIEYLLETYHEMAEGKVKSWGGIDLIALTEQNIAKGDFPLAAWNIDGHINDFFTLANLYWGQGDLKNAALYLEKVLERHQRYLALCAGNGPPLHKYAAEPDAQFAALLLDREFKRAPIADGVHISDGFYPPKVLQDCIFGSEGFNMSAWQASEARWTLGRHPKYMLEGFQVYRKALTGEYKDTAQMLAAHERMWKARAKRSPDAGLLEGYNDNDLIIDYLFAAVLKKIGWEGRYRHSWPNTDTCVSTPETTREPDRFVEVTYKDAPTAYGSEQIITDPKKARAFIDEKVANQLNDQGEPYSAIRIAKNRPKVAGALEKLGWLNDPDALDLMQAYKMDDILSSRSHLFLSDPVRSYMGDMHGWTEMFRGEFGLHSDFIAIAESEEKSDYMDPQGRWYVYWNKDQQIYAVDRDEWHDPELATREAVEGLTRWPSYVSFVAWWVDGTEDRLAHLSIVKI